MRATDGTDVLLVVSDGTLLLADPPAPITWQDVTPGGVPLDWCTVTRTGTTRYVQVVPPGVVTLSPDLPAGTGTTTTLLLRDLHGGAFWQADLDLATLGVRLTLIEEPPVVSGDPIVLLNPGYQGQYLRLHDQGGVPWSLWHTPTEVAVGDQVPLTMAEATPPGGPFAWWRQRDVAGQVAAVSPAAGDCLAVGSPAPPGVGTAEPQAMGDVDGTLWHYGLGPDGSLGMSNWPPLDFAQAATCLVMNDDSGTRWYWRMNPHTGEVVVSSVLEPQTIPWQPLGELGWLSAPDLGGGPPWYAMADASHDVSVRHAWALHQPWGLEALACPLTDRTGHRWLLSLDADGALVPRRQPGEDIPPLRPTLYVRDCIDALRHVEAGGSITTLWIE